MESLNPKPPGAPPDAEGEKARIEAGYSQSIQAVFDFFLPKKRVGKVGAPGGGGKGNFGEV
jgi:hypothetical protein